MMLETLFSLKGRTALVAGAGGLGIGMAEGFAKAGADVIVADVSPENTARGAQAVTDCGTKAWELGFDIYDRVSIEKLVDDALKCNGRIDILANSVGISRMGHAEDLTVDDWQAVINAFLTGVFYTCQIVGQKAMIPQKFGKIINIASISGMVVTGDMGSSYCTAKAGVIQLSKALATEWCKYNINVNCISPGYMLTALTEGFLVGDVLDHVVSGIPKGRIGMPADMAGLAVFLASESAEYIIGQNIAIDGGYTSH